VDGVGFDGVQPGAAGGGAGGRGRPRGEDLEGGGGADGLGGWLVGRITNGVSAAGPAMAIVWRAATLGRRPVGGGPDAVKVREDVGPHSGSRLRD